MKKIYYILYWLVSLTWGCLLTYPGLIVALFLIMTKHKVYRLGPNIYFKVGMGWGGLEFGPVFLVSKDSPDYTILHEAGHGIQNLMWGILMPFVISIPSAIRYWYREIVYRTNRTKYSKLPPYDSIWFEGQATKLGIRYYFIELKNIGN